VEKPQQVGGVTVPVAAHLPNPNGIEFDNLYLDMNGIIHPCFHPENMSPPQSGTFSTLCAFERVRHAFTCECVCVCVCVCAREREKERTRVCVHTCMRS
jgi:XRN 5'-3' exonuclease N-terminus